MREINSVAFQFHAARVDAATLENAQENKIRRVFDEDDVAFVAERFERHVKQLLRAAGDEDAFGRMRAVVSAVQLLQMLRGERAQIIFAGGDAVLQRGLAGFGRTQNFIEQLARNLDGQSGVVREPGGERNEFWPRERRVHEPRDWRHGGALTHFGQDVLFHVKRESDVIRNCALESSCVIVASRKRYRELFLWFSRSAPS